MVAPGLHADRSCFRQSAFLEFQIGVQVDFGCLDLFVAEPSAITEVSAPALNNRIAAV
jgi:hypothetical protein